MIKVFISYTAQANGNANCGWREYPDNVSLPEAEALMADFIGDSWYRMMFYRDEILTHVVKANGNDPIIMEVLSNGTD